MSNILDNLTPCYVTVLITGPQACSFRMVMESSERLVRTWIAAGNDQEIDQLVSELATGQTNILNIVKALGEYLTSEDEKIRTKGVELLSKVLTKCTPELINGKTTHVLLLFYCSKLEDLDTIIPALQGLVPLSKLVTLASDDVATLLKALFKRVIMKALVQSVRFHVYSIIDNLMANHRQALKDMNKEFLNGYVNLADGEKDPRNLMISFAIVRVILIEFEISDFIEPLYNITFCYFPITFRPPPNDPYGITTEDIRLALRACLNATPAFGPLAIPLFTEKLLSGSPVIKKDTLETMCECFPIYGGAFLQSSSRKLWSVLRLEIFQPSNRETETLALKTMQVLVKTVYPDPTMTTSYEGLIQDVSKDCLEYLREPEKSLAKPAVKVICAFLETSSSIATYVSSQVVPYLMQIYASKDDIATRPSVLLFLSDIIASSRQITANANEGSVPDPTENPLRPFVDEFLSVSISGLKVASTRQPSLACLLGLVSSKGLLSDEELGFIVHNVNEILLSDPESIDSCRDDALKLLVCISELSDKHIKEQVLPHLFGLLPDKAPSREAQTERPPDLFEILFIRLTTKLDLVCVPLTPEDDAEPSAAYAHALLLTISQTLTAKIDINHKDVAKYIESLVTRLFNLFVFTALVSSSPDMVATHPRLIQAAAKIISLTVQCVSVQRQQSFTHGLCSAYLDGKLDAFTDGQHTLPKHTPFRPFDSDAPTMQRRLVPLLTAGICGLRREVSIPVLDPSAFLHDILRWSLSQAEDGRQQQACWQLISSIVNKRAEDIAPFLETLIASFWPNEVADANVSVDRRRIALRACTNIEKALILRDHPSGGAFLNLFIETFKDPVIGWDAAKCIGELIATDPVLTKQNHAVVKVLYKQRFVHSVLPRLLGLAGRVGDIESVYIVALASLIRSAPKPTYADSMPSLVPLLLKGLSVPDYEIRMSVIETLLAVAQSESLESSLMAEHALSVVSALLRNILPTDMPSIPVRIVAIRYLGVLPTVVRYEVLHPVKASVVKELGKALDDPKRSVRKEAVDARTTWLKYNG